MPLPSAKICRICSNPLTTHERFAGNICSNWRCRWRALDAQLEAHRNDAAVGVGEPSAKSFPISVVPFHTRPTVPVSQEEREELLAFLETLREALSSREEAPQTVLAPANAEPPVDGEVPNASLATLLGKVCGVCEGFCCHHGAASHAFLDGETLLRFLAEHAYECRGLTDTREHFAKTRTNRMFVVVRHDNQIMRSAFVDESATRPYPTEITAPPSGEMQE